MISILILGCKYYSNIWIGVTADKYGHLKSVFLIVVMNRVYISLNKYLLRYNWLYIINLWNNRGFELFWSTIYFSVHFDQSKKYKRNH